MKNLLIITTNYLGCKCGKPDCNCIQNTGVYLEEFAVPYLIFKASDIELTVASINGGISPIDEKSLSCSNPEEWDECINVLRDTLKLSEVDLNNFDGVYFPGGHGPMFDFPKSDEITKTVEYFYNENKLISAICHGVCALIKPRNTDKHPIIKGKRITSFTNKEESIGKTTELVPFLLETKLKNLGANFVEEAPWAEHVEVDGNLITGQNQNSATLLAEKIIEYFGI